MSEDDIRFYTLIISGLTLLFTIILGVIVFLQKKKLVSLTAEMNLLNQHKFSFSEEKRKTLLRYFDLLSESIHTVNVMSLYSFNESLDKLNKNDELTLPILKRIAMLTRKEKLGQLHNKLYASITSIITEGTDMINDHNKRTEPKLLATTQTITNKQMLQKIIDKDFENTDKLFRPVKNKRYKENVFPLEKEIHDLIYKELKKIMSENN